MCRYVEEKCVFYPSEKVEISFAVKSPRGKGRRKWEDLPFRIGGQDPPSCLSRHVEGGTTRGPGGTKDPPPPTPAPDANSSGREFFLLFSICYKDQSKLKVPKCEIFDLLDFRDLITTKPVQVLGDRNRIFEF
jgi:hypothetical protein